MNIKASYRYQISDHVKPVILYYFILICVYAVLFLTITVKDYQANSAYADGNFNGIELATAIFLFIIGMCSFKESFGMMMQNGISRRTIFISRTLTILSVASVLAFIDQILSLIFGTISKLSNVSVLNYKSIFEMLYVKNAADIGIFQKSILSYLFAFLLYLSIVATGYVISLMFYRMNKAGKIIVGVGAPNLLFGILPLLDTVLTGGRIYAVLGKFLYFSLGITDHQPINALITFSLAFLLFSGIGWLLIRRAQVRTS